jgi:hypothetical protein
MNDMPKMGARAKTGQTSPRTTVSKIPSKLPPKIDILGLVKTPAK